MYIRIALMGSKVGGSSSLDQLDLVYKGNFSVDLLYVGILGLWLAENGHVYAEIFLIGSGGLLLASKYLTNI